MTPLDAISIPSFVDALEEPADLRPHWVYHCHPAIVRPPRRRFQQITVNSSKDRIKNRSYHERDEGIPFSFKKGYSEINRNSRLPLDPTENKD
jgi:hypothetical protein